MRPARSRVSGASPLIPRRIKKYLIGYSFIMPNFIGFSILTLIPAAVSISMSFCDWTGAGFKGFVGLANYAEMIKNSTFQISIRNSMIYALATIPTTLVLSLLVSVVMNRPIKGIGIFRAIYFWPYVTAVVALAAVWNMLFNPDMGLVNQFLQGIGLPGEFLPRWTASTTWSLPTVILAQIWKSIGYYMVIFLAGLQTIPRELYEAAWVDGASRYKSFWMITIPMLTPTIFFVLIMLTIAAFQVYEIVAVMTAGGPGRSSYVIAMHIYRSAFVDNRFGYASAVAMVLFVIVAVLTLIQFKGEKKWVTYM